MQLLRGPNKNNASHRKEDAMGDTLSVLSCTNLNDKCLNVNRVAVELCESIHLHYRDMRFEFNEASFDEFHRDLTSFFDFHK